MRIAVCIRQGTDGEISPFDACAYEAALSIEGAEVTLVSMAAETAKDFLLSLTRLGASSAVLVSDKAFAGSDTLATAYVLSKAIASLEPDYVFCGRQTLIGDTAQTPPMLAELLGYSLITNVLEIKDITDTDICCATRSEGEKTAKARALITLERINTLRRPRLRSKLGSVKVVTASELSADVTRCGLEGSPTRVISTSRKETGKRRCRFIEASELEGVIKTALESSRAVASAVPCEQKLSSVVCAGNAPTEYAKTVSDNVTVIECEDAARLCEQIKAENPDAVLFGSDDKSKRLAATVAARLGLGLCADCTALETDGEQLYMIRPALSGSVIAKIVSRTKPAMATVRTAANDNNDIIVTAGYGVKDSLDKLADFAQRLGGELCATRKAVDNGLLPYSAQVGLTGKTVSPPVYIAVGVSGAVHHIVGMERSGTVIAINPDKDAPIFEYADYGIIKSFEEI